MKTLAERLEDAREIGRHRTRLQLTVDRVASLLAASRYEDPPHEELSTLVGRVLLPYMAIFPDQDLGARVLVQFIRDAVHAARTDAATVARGVAAQRRHLLNLAVAKAVSDFMTATLSFSSEQLIAVIVKAHADFVLREPDPDTLAKVRVADWGQSSDDRLHTRWRRAGG